MQQRELECDLTEAEIQERGQQILAAIETRSRLLAISRSTSAARRDELGSIDRRITRLSEARRLGVEQRLVDVEERRSYKLGTVTIVRLDTGETVEERPLTEAERALELPLGKAARG